jgi:hypothetical protein
LVVVKPLRPSAPDPLKTIAGMISCHPDCRRQRGLPASAKTVHQRDPVKPFTCPLAVAERGFRA